MFWEAEVVWQWYNHVAGRRPSRKRILRLNLDETALRLLNTDGKRAVFCAAKRKRGPRYRLQQVRKVTLRTSLTHIAVVRDDAALRSLWPQVIVTNTKTILRKQLLRLILESPPTARLVRRTTAWNTTELQEKVVG